MHTKSTMYALPYAWEASAKHVSLPAFFLCHHWQHDPMRVKFDSSEGLKINCYACGGKYNAGITSLPSQVDDNSMAIIKTLPVPPCDTCREYLLADALMEKIDGIIGSLNNHAESEILSCAAC
jgi:hypothetical protein